VSGRPEGLHYNRAKTLGPHRRRAALPVPRNQINQRRRPSELAEARRVLSAMVVAVHRALCERLGHRDGQRGIGEPRHRDLSVETRIGGVVQTSFELLVRTVRVGLQLGERSEILEAGDDEAGCAIPDSPREGALDQVNVMEAAADRGVICSRRMRLDRAPVFRIRPRLMSAEIAKE